jgi:hypothetical protein
MVLEIYPSSSYQTSDNLKILSESQFFPLYTTMSLFLFLPPWMLKTHASRNNRRLHKTGDKDKYFYDIVILHPHYSYITYFLNALYYCLF